METRESHDLKAAGSNPAPAIKSGTKIYFMKTISRYAAEGFMRESV